MPMAAVGSGGGAFAGASAGTSAGVVLRDPKDLVQDCLLLHQAPSLRAGNAVIVWFCLCVHRSNYYYRAVI
jgi:hypothetical protein